MLGMLVSRPQPRPEEPRAILPTAAHDYYDAGREEGRLFAGTSRLERVRTQEIVARYLPDALAVVLDVGGGPGTHACWLARRGYASTWSTRCRDTSRRRRRRSRSTPWRAWRSATPAGSTARTAAWTSRSCSDRSTT